MKSEKRLDAVVIGGGIIGAMAARHLLAAGRRITIIERDHVAAGASAGNAGILAFPEIIPIAAPGVIWKAPRWLLDPLGPLAIRPAYAARLAPWFWRFLKASNQRHFHHAIGVHTALMRLTACEYEKLRDDETLASFIVKTGTLDLYDSATTIAAAMPEWEHKAEAGARFRRVGRAEIEELQPGLAPQFAHAFFSDDGLQIADPAGFTRAVAETALGEGAVLERAEVLALAPKDDGVVLLLSGGRTLAAQNAVVACGAWSRRLAASLGEAIPLDTERGYNTTLPKTAFPLRRQLYFNDHGFVVTPLADGIRVGGAVEFGGLNLPPDYRRADALLTRAKGFLPALETEGGTQWMGFRPSTPDCLPVIARSNAAPGVIYAFGHGHLGLTQSAATGRLVAELAENRPPSIDLQPLRADRF
ncbi:NAD(P)/FAD-dependent oxidoreductase [Martelella radicis]|uniref:D-amino-acid dehydrogenase n=1 Tax=Martelella radicis TaxID=1397476 RepID=A0A7W6PA75_9HYPH|nr:FAD-binding oxidoreductase [Martelella radicis]MBB4122545.1 D-amino-acid dehydrogenase [Martelella radicis]